MRKRRKSRAKLSPEQRAQDKIKRTHIREVRAIFELAGFARISGVAGKNFIFEGTAGEFDDLYIFENVIVLLEYTTLSLDRVSAHLKKKKVLYDKIDADTEKFIDHFDGYPSFKTARGDYYEPEKFKIRTVYCSFNKMDKTLKAEVPNVRYLDYEYLKYFLVVIPRVFLGMIGLSLRPSCFWK